MATVDLLRALFVSLCGGNIFRERVPERAAPFNNCVLLPEQSHQQRQKNAQDDAGDDREMKTDVAFGIINVAGQLAEPALAHAAPKQRADHNKGGADHDEQFSNFRHPVYITRSHPCGNSCPNGWTVFRSLEYLFVRPCLSKLRKIRTPQGRLQNPRRISAGSFLACSFLQRPSIIWTERFSVSSPRICKSNIRSATRSMATSTRPSRWRTRS